MLTCRILQPTDMQNMPIEWRWINVLFRLELDEGKLNLVDTSPAWILSVFEWTSEIKHIQVRTILYSDHQKNSLTCDPFKDDVPMYKKTPKRMGIGICLRYCVKNTDTPTRTKINMWVTRCSRTPKNCGFSPGAAHSDSIRRELTWVMDSTVAATNQGRPNREHKQIKSATIVRSKW